MGRVLGDVDRRRQPDGLHRRGRVRADRAGEPGRARSGTALLESGRGHGILPCGLGARDTLRFEAAMPLYGHELSESINPYAAGVGWAVKLDKGEFVGREALRRWKADPGPDAGRPAARGQADRPPGCPVLPTATRGRHGDLRARSPRRSRPSLAMALVEPSASPARHAARRRRPRPPRARHGRRAAVLPPRSAGRRLNPRSREHRHSTSRSRPSRNLHHGSQDAPLHPDARMGASRRRRPRPWGSPSSPSIS